MSLIGRPRKASRTIQWCFRLPEQLASRFDLLLTDPISSRINPNARQDVLIPILQRLWTAVLSDASTIEVGDIVTQLRNRIGDPFDE